MRRILLVADVSVTKIPTPVGDANSGGLVGKLDETGMVLTLNEVSCEVGLNEVTNGKGAPASATTVRVQLITNSYQAVPGWGVRDSPGVRSIIR